MDIVASQILGAADGGIGIPQQNGRIFRIMRKQADPDTAGNVDFPVFQHHGSGDRTEHFFECFQNLGMERDGIHDPLEHLRNVIFIEQAGQDQRKLIAGQSRHGIGGADTIADASRDDFQHLIPDLVPEAFIDEFEIIHVNQGDYHKVILPLCQGHRLAQAVL